MANGTATATPPDTTQATPPPPPLPTPPSDNSPSSFRTSIAAPPSATPPPSPDIGQHTIQSLASRVRTKYPDGVASDGTPYAKLADDEIVHRLTKVSPVYQTWLNDDAIQQLAAQKGTPDIVSTTKEILGHINDAASLGGGRNAAEMWQSAKSKFSALMSHVGPNATGSDPITAVTDWIGDQLDEHAENVARYDPKSQLAQRALATIPLVGSTAASIVDDLDNHRYADAALKTGKAGLSAGVMARLPELKANVEGAVSKAVAKIKPPPDVAAGMAYENAVAPGGLSAADQAALREDWGRARKYIGAETATAPVKGGEGGVMRSAGVARTAANKLWQSNVEPVIDKFATETASTSDVAERIRSTPSDIDIASRPGIQKKVERLANVFDRQMSIAEMNSKVTELNADAAVGKFYDMGPAERAKAIQADPTLHAKVAALDGLREKMFDTIADKWSDEGGQAFREARKDYGALRNVEQNFRDAKVPTPKSLGTRIANTARVSISPHAATEYLRNPVSTVLDLNNPNRLATKAVNKAGQTGEAIPPPPGLPLYSRPAGPAAAQALPPPPTGVAPQAGLPPPLEFPPTTPNAMWEGAQPKAGFDTPSQMVSSIRPPENVKGPSVSASPNAPKQTGSPTKGAPTFYRSEASPLARKYGLISREPSAPGLVSFQDSTTGGSIEMKEGFTEDQLAAKVKAHRDAMAATSESGKSDLQRVKREAAANRFAHEAGPASGQVKAEMGKLKLFDLVTPRQQTTLETLLRGPRWKGMDAGERSAAIKDVLSR
jgi:hypothetical protein